MDQDAFGRAIYLTGPTASGKTAVGVALARRLGAEIVALDSTTIYRRMDIGTAKPMPAERGGIPHHLLDVIEPWESASVSDYRAWARAAVAAIEGRGRRALFVGGTAMYLKVLLRGLFEGPGSDPELRRRLEQDAEAHGDRALHGRLGALDPATAARLHPHDRRRIVRALEVIERTGRPLSAWQVEHHRPAPPEVGVYALEPPRAHLYDRINRRVAGFFDAGLVEEVRALRAGPRPLSPVAAQAIGYREVLAMLAGQATPGATIERIQARSRRFAKRQATWFRGLEEVRPFPVWPDEDPDAIAERLVRRIGGEGDDGGGA
jgi:tRNA dimethylallyltransferase